MPSAVAHLEQEGGRPFALLLSKSRLKISSKNRKILLYKQKILLRA
jgi:hypothetical protein